MRACSSWARRRARTRICRDARSWAPQASTSTRPEEIKACADYLRGQTRVVSPEYIVTLGNFATKFILRTECGITRLRGRLQQAGRFKVFPVFHPAAAIYDQTKRPVLEDFARLGELLA